MDTNFKTIKYILWFDEISKKDIELVGGKNASLGEMYSKLREKGVNIPNGFALTSGSFWYFLKFNNIDKEIKDIFSKFNPNDLESLKQTGKKVRALILQADFPEDLEQEIIDAYRKLSIQYGQKYTDVAVRSSATAEDLKGSSFAGQMESFLNIKGDKNVLLAVKRCIASLFTDRAIAYREAKGFDHLKIALSAGVLKMVRSDSGSSGVMFTLDTETGFPNIVLINSIYGLGELIVKGRITPDEFFIFKPTLQEGFKPIIVKNLGRKNFKYIYSKTGGIKNTVVPFKKQLEFSLNENDILKLAKWAMVIENHYGVPQDIEWAKDGATGELFIVQSRPETVQSMREKLVYEEFQLNTTQKPIVEGIAVGNKIGIGKAKIIQSASNITSFKQGDVLVTKMTDPDWVPIMRLASAIVTDEGGRVCFAAETKILTDLGFLNIKEVVESIKKGRVLKTLSFNKETMVLEWKKIVSGFERQSNLIKVGFSQTGRMKNNYIESTPDHKFLTFQDREVISKEISDIIKDEEGVVSVCKIPQLSNLNLDIKKAYLMGAIFTDGCVSLNQRHGSVSFIQKQIKEKENFINQVIKYFFDTYQYNLHPSKKKPTYGVIRGKEIFGGGATEFRCFKKEIAKDFKNYQQELTHLFLNCNKEALLSFLGGVIDGDGTYNEKANRINIFCAKEYLFEAIVVACLRLGINFQVVPNRTIRNIQIVDNVEEIFQYTTRVKGSYKRVRFGTKFFFASQLLEDIKERINYKGRVMPYIKNNFLIDSEKIRNFIIPMIKGAPENHALTNIIDSPLKMLRTYLEEETVRQGDVFNIEVEDNHNYVVFSSKGTPVLVDNCHAAIVSRELGIPCIVGAKKASKVLKTGQDITVDCSSGFLGKVFLGKLNYKKQEFNLKSSPHLPLKITVNIGSPDAAFKACSLPQDGAGLAREEFIIAEKIKVHPMALYHFNNLKSPSMARAILAKNNPDVSLEEVKKIVKKIENITIEHKDKKEYFVKELAEGIGQIACAFFPKPVIVRFSDFKTNEYAQLIGGSIFEPKEENPMIGWRGASRYYDERFKPAFLMECDAIRRARDVFGLKNIKLMVPFCRTIEEGEKVLAILKEKGLERGKDGLEIYVMCEIPSNVILIEQFLEIFDGMSIGSNDLTQLTLGLDRDNGALSHIGDERNMAVKELLKKIIKTCREKNKYCGICGQAPSDFPDFAEFLMQEGIESISLNPDTVIKTILNLSNK